MDDVVGVGVLEEVVEEGDGEELGEDLAAGGLVEDGETLLDDVATEFLRRELDVAPLEGGLEAVDRRRVLHVQHVLDGVVPGKQEAGEGPSRGIIQIKWQIEELFIKLEIFYLGASPISLPVSVLG